MATYSINTTAIRETALQTYATERNAERAAQTPPKPALTAQDYMQRRVNEMLDNWSDEQRERLNLKSIKDALPTATDAQIANVKAALGI